VDRVRARRPVVRNSLGRGFCRTPPEEVGLALDWLALVQSPDGRWDADGFAQRIPGVSEKIIGPGYPAFDTGVTGLAVLAFLRAGYSPVEGPYHQNLEGGIEWLRRDQDAKGCFGPRATENFVYGHASATLAMVEAYRTTGRSDHRRSAEAGVGFALACRNPHKAWRYGVRPGDNDVSVTGWMMLALLGARDAGIEVPEGPLLDARDFVASVTNADGRVGYTRPGIGPVRPVGNEETFPAEHSESLTALGVYVRHRLGDDDPILAKGMLLVAGKPPVWQKKSLDFYYWYHGAQAATVIGGAVGDAWRSALREAVVPRQRAEPVQLRGSWDPDSAWGGEGGRVYSTAILTLALLADSE